MSNHRPPLVSCAAAVRLGTRLARHDSTDEQARDILLGKGEGLRPYALSAHQAVLEEVLDVSHSERLRDVESFDTRGPLLYQSACMMRLEGAVSKRPHAPYRAQRGAGWEKSKCRPSQVVVIGGWKQELMRPFKGLLVGVYEGGS